MGRAHQEDDILATASKLRDAPWFRTTLHGSVLAALLLRPGAAWAKPPPADEEANRAASSAPSETPTEPSSEPGAPIRPPRAIGSLQVEYPAGETGDEEVVLELLVSEEGRVEKVQVVTGRHPFGGVAEKAARDWRFVPAERNRDPVRARIRVQVRFSEPRPPPPAQAPTSPEPSEKAGAPSEVTPKQPAVEVVVQGRRAESSRRLTRAEVRQLPGAFGDPFRAIEILPGVTPVASGLPYFFVRGAPPGNVGYFFDEIAVPGLYHVAAGPAVIHPAFVEDVRLYSGAYPARYGRFAGGIVAASVAQPEHRFRGEANIRLVDSGLMLEVPFADQRGNIMVAGRYSYTGLIVSLLAPEVEIGYWDYQGRVQYQFSERDTVTVFGFGSYDFLGAETDGEFQDLYDVTFHRVDLRYDRRLTHSSALRLATTIGSDRIHALEGRYLIGRRIRPRIAYTTSPSSRVMFQAGADVQLRSLEINVAGEPEQPITGPGGLPPDFNPRPLPGLPPRRLPPNEDTEAALAALFATRRDLVGGGWFEWALDLGSGVSVTPGLRLDVYSDSGVTQLAPEPRISARYQITHKVALVHDLGLAHQPPSFAVPVPGLQGAASDGLQRGVQSSAGVEAALGADVSVSLTGFQNVLFGSTDALGLANLQRADEAVNNDLDRSLAHTYGAELLMKRSLSERLGGFVSYTLSRSTRSVGRLYGPASFDRTHVFNAALAYDIGKGWRVGGRGTVYTGTPAEVAYPDAARIPPRTPPFYRFDWRLEKRWPLGETGFWAVVLEVLNTTLHKETLDQSCYAYGCEGEAIGPVTVPSIGLEASF